jgi:hypothetical protein
MIRLKAARGANNLNFNVCEEEFCEDDSTRIWASSETRIVDLCDMHYGKAIE